MTTKSHTKAPIKELNKIIPESHKRLDFDISIWIIKYLTD